ncbi:hypothetical protein BGZ54_008903 [Gamsiella multidivaricata]|nr:hypothetical protein BGZ54_008903 [Gamsiella multidivaricata]
MNLEWTPRLEKAFRKLNAKQRSSTLSLNEDETRTAQEVDSMLELKDPVYVNLDLVRRMSVLLLRYSASEVEQGISNDASEDWIHAMIRGSSVYVPKPAPKERSPELDRIMEGIKAQVAEKEYQRMISSIDPNARGSIANSLRQDMKDMKDVKAHAIGIINVLYTGAAVFTAVFMISAHFTEDLGMRVLLAFLAFVLIVACEAYLYSRHASVADAPLRKKLPRLPDDVVITTRTFVKEKSS